MNAFCCHGVPQDCYCRWCREGGQPEPPPRLTKEGHARRVAEIRKSREQLLAELDAIAATRRNAVCDEIADSLLAVAARRIP
jgi:hypothetical protein